MDFAARHRAAPCRRAPRSGSCHVYCETSELVFAFRRESELRWCCAAEGRPTATADRGGDAAVPVDGARLAGQAVRCTVNIPCGGCPRARQTLARLVKFLPTGDILQAKRSCRFFWEILNTFKLGGGCSGVLIPVGLAAAWRCWLFSSWRRCQCASHQHADGPAARCGFHFNILFYEFPQRCGAGAAAARAGCEVHHSSMLMACFLVNMFVPSNPAASRRWCGSSWRRMQMCATPTC